MHTISAKPYKGKSMEGRLARWYARTRSHDMADFRDQARKVAEHLAPGSRVLEAAPGPGFFAVELAKLGDFAVTGLDISRTLVQIAADNAAKAGVKVDFQLGNVSAMLFEDASFDFLYCMAAFKNFSEPLKAINEMHRVLRAGAQALILDLRKDVPLKEVHAYVKQSGRSGFDAWLTNLTFRHLLVKRAYTQQQFVEMARQSRFGSCEITVGGIGLEVRLTKP